MVELQEPDGASFDWKPTPVLALLFEQAFGAFGDGRWTRAVGVARMLGESTKLAISSAARLRLPSFPAEESPFASAA